MIILAYTLATIPFLLLQNKRTFHGRFILKILPLLLLGLYALAELGSSARLLVVTAIFFSACGDIALELNDEKDRLFPVGLALFLMAHIFYIVAFMRKLGVSSIGLVLAALLAVFAVGLLSRLWPNLGKFKLPVLAYVLVIWIMSSFAALQVPANWLLFLGAFIFMISDSLIAINKFWMPIRNRNSWVMVTYYLAQLMIVIALVL